MAGAHLQVHSDTRYLQPEQRYPSRKALFTLTSFMECKWRCDAKHAHSLHRRPGFLHLPVLCCAKGMTLPLPYAVSLYADVPLVALFCCLLVGIDEGYILCSSPASPDSICIGSAICPASSSSCWHVYWGMYSGVSGDQSGCELESLGGLDRAAGVATG